MSRWPSAPERFWSGVEHADADTCWMWTGYVDGEGYGYFVVDGRRARVHRYSYELMVGPIPGGLVLDHLCRNRKCVNPKHLEPVTNAENVLRGESASAASARATECINGHELSGENLRLDDDGHRRCKTCERDQGRERLRLRRAGALNLPPCNNEGCTKQSYVRGLCNAHYLQSRKRVIA